MPRSAQPRCICPSGCKTVVGYYRAFGTTGDSHVRPRRWCEPCRIAGCNAIRIGTKCPVYLKSKKRSRYGVKRVRVQMADGSERSIASQHEATRSGELRYLEAHGHISNLEEQVAYELRLEGRRVVLEGGVLIETYVADARYRAPANGPVVVEDSKDNLITRDYERKRKWMLQVYGITIYEHHKARGNKCRKPSLSRKPSRA